MRAERRELGSSLFLDWNDLDGDRGTSPWDGRPAVWFRSGRDALRALIRHGKKTSAWERVAVPTYFCPKVTESIASEAPIRLYPDRPVDFDNQLATEPAEAALLVNTLGLRGPAFFRAGARVGATIEDHTHSPWSRAARESRADFCIASLRKTLPLPDGAVLWSPLGHDLPDAPPLSGSGAAAVQAMMAGMLLKAAYLEGRAIEKSRFRNELIAGEGAIASGEPSGMSSLSSALFDLLPIETWWRRRTLNHDHAVAGLEGASGVTVLRSREPGAAFCVSLLCDSPAIREETRRTLIEQDIYPAILWNLGVAPGDRCAEDLDLSRRILNLHCDQRYGTDDMDQLIECLRDLLADRA